MAWVVLDGEVNRVIGKEGRGFSVKETFTKRDGSEGNAYYTVWFEDRPEDLDEGYRGKFSGSLSVRPNTYPKNGETVHAYDVTLNNAKFEPAPDAEDEF